jgi:hypothetical protein
MRASKIFSVLSLFPLLLVGGESCIAVEGPIKNIHVNPKSDPPIDPCLRRGADACVYLSMPNGLPIGLLSDMTGIATSVSSRVPPNEI